MHKFNLPHEKAFSYLVYNQDIYRENVKNIIGLDLADPKEIRNHWLEVGIHDGIPGSDIFDVKWFIENIQVDLKLSENAKVIEYWVDFGVDKGLPGSPLFSAKDYGFLHTDLRNTFGENYRDLSRHWNNHGRREKRQCLLERALNEQDKLIQTKGIDVCSKFVFDPNFYKDQANISGYKVLGDTKSLEKHWRTIGVNDGVRASLIFDVKYYIDKHKKILNKDVRNNYSLAIEHWLNIGIKNGYQGSREFDICSYLNAHKDLQDAFGKDYLKALNHWIHHGVREGREISSPEQMKDNFLLKKIKTVWPNFLLKSSHEKNILAYLKRLAQLSNTPQSIWLKAEDGRTKLASIYHAHGPLVSVIIPYHNREITVKFAIDSILSQTYTNYEIILVDNKSKKPIRKYLEKNYLDSLTNGRLRVVETNVGGVCPARNLGLSIANGKYIAYLDSDNFWDADFLKIMVGTLERERSDCAYSSIISANLDEMKIKLQGQRFDIDKLKVLNFIDMNCFVHTKKLYDTKGGFDISLKRLVDWDLILKYCNGSKVSFCSAPLVHYISASYIDSITNTEKLFPPYELITRKPYSDQKKTFIGSLVEHGKNNIAYILWDQPSNSEKFINYELEWLIQSGFTVTVFYKRNSSNSLIKKVEYVKIDDSDELAIELINKGIDFAFTHFIYPTTTLLTYPACEKAEIPFSCVGHGVDIFHFNNKPRLNLDEISRSKFLVNLYAPGAYHRTFMRMQGALESKIKINPQAIDVSFFGQSSVGKIKNKVVCIGRFIEKKGIDLVIKSADFCPNLDFEIYGFGELEEEYLSLCRKAKHKNVSIKGAISDMQQLRDVYAKAEYFILPCRKAENGDMDGFPTVLGEALASDCLPITTDISSIGSYLRDMDSAIFIQENTVEGVVEAILRATGLSTIARNAIINNGMKIVSKNFSVNTVMKNRLSDYYGYELSIFLVSYNSLACLKEIIRRVYKYTRVRFKIIIIDNNSNAETKEFLNELDQNENVTVIFQQDNTFCGPASNRALANIDTEYAIYLCSNEGFVLDYEWEKEFIDYMSSHPDVAIAGGIDYSPSFSTYDELINNDFFDGFRNKNWAKNRKERFMYIQGGLYILRMSIYREVGGFSNAFPHNLMDVEYSFYLQSLGYKIAQLNCVVAKTVKTLPSIVEELSLDTKVAHPMTLELANEFDCVASGEKEWCPILRQAISPKKDSLSLSRTLLRLINSRKSSYISRSLLINDIPKPVLDVINSRYNLVDINAMDSDFESLHISEFLIVDPSYEQLLFLSKLGKGVEFYTTNEFSSIEYPLNLNIISTLISFKEHSHNNIYKNVIC